MTRKHSTSGRQSVLAATLFVLIASTLCCNPMSNLQTPQQATTLDWDLSRSHTVRDVDWPPTNQNSSLGFEHVSLRLKLAEDKVFRGQLRNVFCEREGDEVTGVILHTDKRTLDEAYTEAQRLARDWGFDEESLNQWYARMRSGNGQSDERFENFRNDLNPTLGLRVLHSFNDLQPWYVSFEVRWPQST